MADVSIRTARGEMPVYLATPAGDGPWPGVVVIHDALGMSSDLRTQADWLAGEGFLCVAPDLYYWGRRITCIFSFVRDWSRPLSDLDAAREWLGRAGELHRQDRRHRVLHGRRLRAGARSRPRLLRGERQLRRAHERLGARPGPFKRYPDAGHGFPNDHDPAELPLWIKAVAKLAAAEYDEASATDARRRIAAFFRKHLA